MESAARLTPVLEKALTDPGLPRRDRAFITELVYGSLRQRAYLDFAIDRYLDRPPARVSGRLRCLLRLGAYQLLFLSRVPASAAVNETVRLARSLGGRGVTGFVNAVMRQTARSGAPEAPPLAEDPVRHISIRYSHPEWLVSRWVKRYGIEPTIRITRENNLPAPLTVRVNRLKTTREALIVSLEAEGVRAEPCAVSEDGIRLTLGDGSRGVPALKSFVRGDFYVQDEAAQLVTALVDPQPGERILDACAAPGGKTTHMAERMDDRGRIVALDADRSRLRPLVENVKRLGITIIEPSTADVTRSLARLGRGTFDRVLVDAPCSGFGLLRRNPEARWRKTEDLIFQYHSRQVAILAAVAPVLKPGGVLVYSTCTTEPEENERVVEKFRMAHSSFVLEDVGPLLPGTAAGFIPGTGTFSTVSNPFQMDAFFAARMINKQ